MRSWLLLAAFCEAVSDDAAASGAASYWRGGRVQAAEEPNSPAPIIEIEDGQLQIDYQGDAPAQECLEYYLDKLKVEELQNQVLHEKLAASTRQRSGSIRPRGVLVFLLMENADKVLHKDLALSLRCLARFFWRYPVVIFHTNSTTASEMDWMRSVIPNHLHVDFEEVALGFPASLADFPGGPDAFLRPPSCMLDGQHQWGLQRSCGCRCPAWRPQCWPLNWMHATHFFTAGMFRTRTFQDGGYHYFLRLDIDLFFVEGPVLDPFQHMADHGCVMVYDRLSREAPGCFDDFNHRCQEFLDMIEYDGQPDGDILQVGYGPAAAGGQWTIGDVRLFTSPSYLQFADYFASGIYTHRWADQLILLRGAALFGPRASPHVLPEVPAVSLCLASLFRAGAKGGLGGAPPGLVHLKGGFRQDWLLETCAAEDAFS